MRPFAVPPSPRTPGDDSVTMDLSADTGRLCVDCPTCSASGLCVAVDAEGVAEARRFLHDHANCSQAEADRARRQQTAAVRARRGLV